MFVLEVINFEVHAFLGAYYLKNENQGNESLLIITGISKAQHIFCA